MIQTVGCVPTCWTVPTRSIRHLTSSELIKGVGYWKKNQTAALFFKIMMFRSGDAATSLVCGCKRRTLLTAGTASALCIPRAFEIQPVLPRSTPFERFEKDRNLGKLISVG